MRVIESQSANCLIHLSRSSSPDVCSAEQRESLLWKLYQLEHIMDRSFWLSDPNFPRNSETILHLFHFLLISTYIHHSKLTHSRQMPRAQGLKINFIFHNLMHYFSLSVCPAFPFSHTTAWSSPKTIVFVKKTKKGRRLGQTKQKAPMVFTKKDKLHPLPAITLFFFWRVMD